MKYLLPLTALFLMQAYAQETCYSIQLASSKHNTFLDKKYPNECKILNINNNYTVRCGCTKTTKELRPLFKQLHHQYPQAYITKTYSYRFKEQNTQTIHHDVPPMIMPTSIPKPASHEVAAATAATKQTTSITTQTVQEPTTNVIYDDSYFEDVTKPKKTKKKKHSKKKKKLEKKRKKLLKKIAKKNAKREKELYYPYTTYLKVFEGRKKRWYDYRWKFGGQISYDIAHISLADDDYTENDFRRVRLYHEGSFLDKKLFYEFEYNFLGDNNFKDNYIGYQNKYKPLKLSYRLKAGNIKIPFSLEGYSTSKNITFMERALNDCFIDSRRKLGVELLVRKKKKAHSIVGFVDIFGNSIDERRDDVTNHPGYSTRIVYAYKPEKHKVFTLGGSVLLQDFKGEKVRYKQESESNLIYEKYVSVKIKDVDTVKHYNLESLFIYNKFSLQGEYTRVDMDANDNFTFAGYYLQGSYFLRGDGRNYKTSTATLQKIKPKKWGDVEIAFRYSHLNLNDKDEHGGEQTDYNFALNWYITPELKWMFNYIMAYPENTDDYDGMLQIWQTRVQFAF